MTAGDLVRRLRARHPAPEWAAFEEFANGTGSRYSRSADMVVFNTYPSGGHLSIAYEVKISRADFATELADPSKREWLEKHFAECWFVMPRGLVAVDEIPVGWGLLETHGEGLRATKKARQDLAKCLKDPICVSLVRRMAKAEEVRLKEQDIWAEVNGRRLGIEDLRRIAQKAAVRDYNSARADAERFHREEKAHMQRRVAELQRLTTFRHDVRRAFGYGVTDEEILAAVRTLGVQKIEAPELARRLRAAADSIMGAAQ